jgi:hypothetical protein
MQAREADAMPRHTVHDARSEQARARRWSQALTDLACTSEDRAMAAEAVRHALERTERAAHELEARRRALGRASS